VRRFFPSTKYLDYALTVERYTLQKAANLVMNVRIHWLLCVHCGI
jgi:ATP citrate (pro-S)-lyase